MTRKNFYIVVNLTNVVIGIGQTERPDARNRSIMWKCYPRKLSFKFTVGIFRYRIGGSKAYWVVIFWIPQGASTSSTNFIKNIARRVRRCCLYH